MADSLRLRPGPGTDVATAEGHGEVRADRPGSLGCAVACGRGDADGGESEPLRNDRARSAARQVEVRSGAPSGHPQSHTTSHMRGSVGTAGAASGGAGG